MDRTRPLADRPAAIRGRTDRDGLDQHPAIMIGLAENAPGPHRVLGLRLVAAGMVPELRRVRVPGQPAGLRRGLLVTGYRTIVADPPWPTMRTRPTFGRGHPNATTR